MRAEFLILMATEGSALDESEVPKILPSHALSWHAEVAFSSANMHRGLWVTEIGIAYGPADWNHHWLYQRKRWSRKDRAGYIAILRRAAEPDLQAFTRSYLQHVDSNSTRWHRNPRRFMWDLTPFTKFPLSQQRLRYSSSKWQTSSKIVARTSFDSRTESQLQVIAWKDWSKYWQNSREAGTGSGRSQAQTCKW